MHARAPRHRRGQGTVQFQSRRGLVLRTCRRIRQQQLLRSAQELHRRINVFRLRAQQRQVRERREAGGLALHELLFGEGVVAAGDQRLQQRVRRVVRLQQRSDERRGGKEGVSTGRSGGDA